MIKMGLCWFEDGNAAADEEGCEIKEREIELGRYSTSSQAPSYARRPPSETMTYSLNHSLADGGKV